MNECTFIIFGATGDLTRRKLIPALCRLIKDNQISKFLLIGTAREETTVQHMLERAREFCEDVSESVWQRLQDNSVYYQLDVTQPDKFQEFAQFIINQEKVKKLKGNRLVHFAVPSILFCPITVQLGKHEIIRRGNECGYVNDVWQRIIYEKPFGVDAESAHEINRCIKKYFSEGQVYRIDHYLTKELVASILLVRFTNMIFEPLWNKTYIEHVEIIMTEKLGMEGRGNYYDQYGVLKDVVQSHGMQLLSLIAMELPEQLQASNIQDGKAAVLKHVSCVNGILGQYNGYHQEKGIAPQSSTPTFAALMMHINTQRWKGVPFFIKAGKKLNKKDTSIHIKFKEVTCKLRERCVYSSNYLSIYIAPEPKFVLQLNTKEPRSIYEVLPIDLTFSHNYTFGGHTPEAYEILYERVMEGDQSISVRFDEIEYAWSIIDDILNKKLSMYPYEPGSEGPKELKNLRKIEALK